MQNGRSATTALAAFLLWSWVMSHGLFVPQARAYPPAPHHLFYGLVRDEYGTPLSTGAELILETSSGVQIKGAVISGQGPGVNYNLEVPMDAGIASDLYKPTALRPSVPFRIKVKIGNVTYLPIEMSGNFAQLGQPGRRTLLNLTLGEDSDGDGLPDAWERMINPDLSKVNPLEDADGDKLNNLQEYLAGTYAFDPQDGFTLKIARFNGEAPVLEFLAIRGRTYTLQGSADLKTWATLSFRFSTEAGSVARSNYQATDVRPLQVEASIDANQPTPRFFRLMVQ